MTRKALLIGAQPPDLTGVVNDVDAMAQALEPRGFQVERLLTPHATRAAILDAYEKLIVDAGTDDAFVVYYSGHGGLARSPGNPDLQFIVPDDYTDSDDSDFRGITGVELSVLLARVTDVAPNTTVIMDCCHAAHMSRQLDMRVKALLHPMHWRPTYETIEDHVRRLVEDGLPVQLRHLVSNPRAVRAVACAPSESAWETANRDGVVMGLFTDALSRALRDSQGLRLNWSTLMDAVRWHVQVFTPVQRPEAEGPAGRQPFETAALEPLDSLPVVVLEPERIQLLGAPLLGVEAGDEFAIMPAGAAGPQDHPVIATATVDQVLPTVALARLDPATAGPEVPADARAHRTRAAAPALPVRLPQDHPATPELATRMAVRPLLRRADPDADERIPVEVTADADGRLVVRDDAGPLHPPYLATPDGIDSIVANLQRIAQATALRRLGSDSARLSHRVVIEWGRVRNGQEEPLSPSGALLFAYAGERVFFRLRNEGQQAVYVSLVDIGISYRIQVLTESDPSGIRLAAGESYTYGWDEDQRRLAGVAMIWPEGIDTAAARPETVLVLISDGPVDVGVLRQEGVRTAIDKSAAGSRLEGLLDQAITGASREVGTVPAGTVGFDVQAIDFTVSPTAPPATERASFLLDDRPELPVRLLAPRGAAPARVAVRIAELVVHRNRALRSADIRVDAIVQTGGAGDQPVYRAETMRFSNVRDEYRLPLDNVLVYHGPAVDFLDIAVWVSRDATGSLALGDLLERKLASPVLPTPGGSAAAALTLAVPQAAAAVAVVSAGALLVNTAYELLIGVVGQSVGLYRTSMLAQERFGIGRHERHPQDFSFTFSIEAVA